MKRVRIDTCWGFGIALILATLAAYSPLVGNGFVTMDDPAYLTDNPHIRSLDPVSLFKLLFLFHQSNWHPLTWLSHGIDYHLWGVDPVPHHAINLLLHIVNALLVMRLGERLLRLAGNPDPALAAGVCALLFAIHPQHVESVAWLSERKDLLCALFFLLAVQSYLEHSQSGRRGHGYATLGYFLLAMLSKPMAISLPVVLLVLDYYPLRRWNRLADLLPLLWEKLALFVLALVLAVLTLLAQRDAVEYIHLDLVSRLLNAAYSLVAYPWKWLQPIGLSPFYPFPAWILERSPLIGLPIVLVGAAAALAGWRAAKAQDRHWLALLLFYVITLAPTIGIIKVGGQAFADRYTYLPLIGCYLLAGQGFQCLWNGSTQRVGIALGGIALCLLLIALTWQQTQVWRNDKNLWFTVAYYYPGEVDIAYINLGVALSKEGHYEEAIANYQKADRPESAVRLRALLNQGVALEQLGRPGEAEAVYRKAQALFPNAANVLLHLANLARQQGDLRSAETHYRQALQLDPNQPLAKAGLLEIERKGSESP